MQNEKLEERIININGLKTFIRIKGQGETLLILHGWGASSRSWEEVQDLLSKNFRVICLDLPGFGKSDPPPYAWDVENYAQFIFALLRELKLKQFYLLGHSFGGAVALKLALIQPDKVKRLILVNAAIVRKPKTILKKILSFFAGIISLFNFLPGYQFFRGSFYRLVLRKTDYLKTAGVMRQTFTKVISENLQPYCSKINIPTLIIWGEQDKITPLKDGILINKLIPNSRIITIKKTEHAPNLSHPEELARIIKENLSK
ncbi:MAG: alpha/beta hydrolase [Candidatus Pacebacteria bacterium]|nr:alpha/beta hydrolase [Candidatus Paceibacterota bacterium]